jgi:uncharacterized membrane protein YraQ (UPF0718 family)
MDIFGPLASFADFITYGVLNLGKESYLGEAVNFFIYDLIKIGILLVVINYLMAIIRYKFPTDKVKNILAKRRWFGLDYLFAALLGVITPFCSCSSIPLFIGFVGAGIPLGVTFAFLISSPLINEASLYLFPAMFGLRTTIIYNLIGLLVAIAGGILIQYLKLERYISEDLLKLRSGIKVIDMHEKKKPTVKKLALYFWQDSWKITSKLIPYIIIGVGIGAIIHGFVPTDFAQKYLSSREWWAVPFAVILGAPFYANSIGVIPVMEALINKGVPIGTALAFMTSVVTISIPEMLMLRKVMRWQLQAVFFGITIIGIIIMGYVLNLVI